MRTFQRFCESKLDVDPSMLRDPDPNYESSQEWSKFLRWKQGVEHRLQETGDDPKIHKLVASYVNFFAHGIARTPTDGGVHTNVYYAKMDRYIQDNKHQIPFHLKKGDWQKYQDLSGSRPYWNFSEEDMKTAYYVLWGERMEGDQGHAAPAAPSRASLEQQVQQAMAKQDWATVAKLAAQLANG